MTTPTLPVMAVVTVLAVIAADQLLVTATAPGWTLGAVPAMGVALVCWRCPLLMRNSASLSTIAATVVACLVPLYDRSWLAPCLATVGIGLLVLQANGWRWIGVAAALAAMAGTAAVSPLQLKEDVCELSAQRPVVGTVWSSLATWFVPLIIATVFGIIFTVANPVIGTWLAAVGSWISQLLDGWWQWLPSPFRIIVWWFLGLGAWWALRGSIAQEPSAVAKKCTMPADRTAKAIRILVVCNAVFLVQTSLDGVYLWGGAALPTGMSWATYAHRGSWPLMIAVMISVGLVLWAFAPGGAAERSRPARWLVGAWLFQNALLVAGAVRRLDLYVDVYGLSYWRLAAGLWMLLVAVGVGLLLWRILAKRSNGWLIDVNALATVVALLVAAGCNADGVIAWHNVRHCREAGGTGTSLDLDYLRQLGPGASPAVQWFAEHAHDRALVLQAQVLNQEYQQKTRQLLEDWRGFTVVRWQAVVALTESYEPSTGGG